MRLVTEGDALPRQLAFMYLGLAVAGLLLLRLWPEVILSLAHCPLREHFGIPCLTCGGTHAAVALSRLDIVTALIANPLVCLAGVLLILWSSYALVATIIPTWRRTLCWRSREIRALRAVLILSLLGSWVYQLVRV